MPVWSGIGAHGIFVTVGYMFCSATMLIANKYAVWLVPTPSLILLMQLLGTAAVVKGAHLTGLLTSCDALEWSKVAKFAPVAIIFTATIWTNMASLQYANVETFMVFRFSTPLCISVADYLFLGREFPSLRSLASLILLLLGGVGYTLTDSSFDIHGYIFCGIWYVIFCLDQIYLKHIVDTVEMDSMWGRVFYSNLLSSLPLLAMSFFGEDPGMILSSHLTVKGAAVILLTVALGAAMSYFAWSARSVLSATAFTVVGNLCKILTLMINFVIWDKHASAIGVSFLFLSFGGAYFYKQAPLKETPKPAGHMEFNTIGATIPEQAEEPGEEMEEGEGRPGSPNK